uniref:Nicotinamide-nucleotide adenylyltransferase n=1 Tax=Elaeophora elaphi TaxID=1147741 RepID=A0A0R3RR24_9BILA
MNSLEGARVALLACGCYNPPTIMHLRMFESARDFLEVRYGCEVVEGILSPVADYFGKADLLPATHRQLSMINIVAKKLTRFFLLMPRYFRYKMSELAVKSSTWIRADQWECSQQQWTKTLLVLVHFKQVLDRKYNNDTRLRLMLLCGGDVVDSFKRLTTEGDYLWDPEDIGAIIRDFGLVVLSRQNSEPMKTLSQLGYNGQSLANVFVFEDTALPNDISSTRLRAAVRRGESIKYCTVDSVVDYIKKHQLYRVKNNQAGNRP